MSPQYQLWHKEGFEYAFVIEPFGSALITSASQRVMNDMADSKPEQPTEKLEDGSFTEINTPEFIEALSAWSQAVNAETQRRIDEKVIGACIKEVLKGSPKKWEVLDYKKMVGEYREEKADLVDLFDFPEDDLELFIRCIALPNADDVSDLLTHCYYGRTVEERVKSFRSST